MKSTLLIYGLFLGTLVFLLKITEYWFWVKLNAFDVYLAVVAIIFMCVGLWLGHNLHQKKNIEKTITLPSTLVSLHDENNFIELGISKREYEVLILISRGMSNQEIADSLFVSQNTIKTHSSRLFEKLDVKNRTHAIIKAKELGILSI